MLACLEECRRCCLNDARGVSQIISELKQFRALRLEWLWKMQDFRVQGLMHQGLARIVQQMSWISTKGGAKMIKVRTFTNELRIFHTMNELAELDRQVNKFIEDNKIEKVVSVSDTCTTGEGSTCGIIRVLAYKA